MTHPLYNQSGLQKNNKSHVLYALANKQMELNQIQDEYEAKINKIKTDLLALETTICLFDSNGSGMIKKLNKRSSNSSTKPKTRNRYFKSGEAKTIILRILRESNISLSTEDISKKAIVIQNLQQDDDFILRSIGKTIISVLRRLEDNNIIILDDSIYKGRLLYWKIKD